MRSLLMLGLLLLSLAPAGSPAFEQKVLPSKKLLEFKKEPCTFIHVWATWCTICIEELPRLIKVLNQLHKKRVNLVVVDTSKPFVQKNFSIYYMKTQNPEFPTYQMPDVDDAQYIKTLAPDWPEILPYSLLFHRGEKKQVWVGKLDLPKLSQQILQLCK